MLHDMVEHCEIARVSGRAGRLGPLHRRELEVLRRALARRRDLRRDVPRAGFVRVGVTTLRKRTSKKELFEFVVSAQKA